MSLRGSIKDCVKALCYTKDRRANNYSRLNSMLWYCAL